MREVTQSASARRADAPGVGAAPRWLLAGAQTWLLRWWIPLAIFAASRVVDAVFLALAAEDQVALARTRPDYYVYEPTPAGPGYGGVVSNWDAQWYRRIATDGYELPAEGGSAVDTRTTLWAWAFPPAYPMLVRLVMTLTSLSFPVAATIVSCLAGAAAMILMYRLVLRSGGPFLAGATVLFSSFFVSAPLLQIGYSESLALLFVMAALNFMVDRHYLWASAAVLALSMTRIVTLPFVLVVVVHAFLRFRSEGPFWKARRTEAAALGLVALVSVFGLVSWMLLASIFIGTQAGLQRSAGQRSLYLGWFEDAFRILGVTGPLILVAFLALLAFIASTPRARSFDPELRAWSVAYPAFLLAMTPILPAVLRYLLLVPILPVILAGTPRSPSRRNIAWVAAVLILLLASQWWYVNTIVVVWSETPRTAP